MGVELSVGEDGDRQAERLRCNFITNFVTVVGQTRRLAPKLNNADGVASDECIQEAAG